MGRMYRSTLKARENHHRGVLPRADHLPAPTIDELWSAYFGAPCGSEMALELLAQIQGGAARRGDDLSSHEDDE